MDRMEREEEGEEDTRHLFHHHSTTVLPDPPALHRPYISHTTTTTTMASSTPPTASADLTGSSLLIHHHPSSATPYHSMEPTLSSSPLVQASNNNNNNNNSMMTMMMMMNEATAAAASVGLGPDDGAEGNSHNSPPHHHPDQFSSSSALFYSQHPGAPLNFNHNNNNGGHTLAHHHHLSTTTTTTTSLPDDDAAMAFAAHEAAQAMSENDALLSQHEQQHPSTTAHDDVHSHLPHQGMSPLDPPPQQFQIYHQQQQHHPSIHHHHHHHSSVLGTVVDEDAVVVGGGGGDGGGDEEDHHHHHHHSGNRPEDDDDDHHHVVILPQICRICGRGEEDGRPLLHFESVEHDVLAARAAPSVVTFTEDIKLHIFCGKTASILPSVNQPDLEILTKAGLKNKHGIGPEVNAALARTRCALVSQAGAKEKHYYLVREFEAHLAAIRHTHITFLSPPLAPSSEAVAHPGGAGVDPYGGMHRHHPPSQLPPRLSSQPPSAPPPPAPVHIHEIPAVSTGGLDSNHPPSLSQRLGGGGGIPPSLMVTHHAYEAIPLGSSADSLSRTAVGASSLSSPQPLPHYSSVSGSSLNISSHKSIPVKAAAGKLHKGGRNQPREFQQAIYEQQLHLPLQPPMPPDDLPPDEMDPDLATSGLQEEDDLDEIDENAGLTGEEDMDGDSYPLPDGDPTAGLPDIDAMTYPLEVTSEGKIRCGCGGTHLPPGNPRGTQSWRNHVMTKRHQKWMEENGLLGAV